MNKVNNALCIIQQGKEQKIFAGKNEVIVCKKKDLIKMAESSLQKQNYNNIIKLMKTNNDLELYTNKPKISKIKADKKGHWIYNYEEFENNFPIYDIYQFAFITNNKIKCLYHPETKKEKSIGDQFSFWSTDDDKNTETDNQWYEIIVKAIINKELNDEIITDYLNETYSFFSRRKVKKIFCSAKNLDDSLVNCLVTSYDKNSLFEENIMKRTFLSLVHKHKIEAEQFKNLPFIHFKCEHGKCEELEKKISGEYPVRFHREKLVSLPEVVFHKNRTANLTNLEQIGVYDAQEISTGQNIKIGVIDTGIDYEHEELKHSFGEIKGNNFVNDNSPIDDNGHGTHVSGIIGGITTGVAPGCTLYALKVLDRNGVGNNISVIRAIDWSITNNLDILNMSLGSSSYSELEHKAIKIAAEKGLVIVSAAGNDGTKEYNYPASFGEVVSVSAVDGNNKKADFSNYNDKIKIAAPGVEIYSTFKNNSYRVLSGTSMSTPHVTGVFALVKSLNQSSPEILKEIIKRTAKSLHNNLYYGAGLVRADDAVRDAN
ncbi:S8 family peptidase [Candidatus Woesearchaeota archaeon]|nr:S8 family peptidase [Candidatus Woesearchaeota archaeon]